MMSNKEYRVQQLVRGGENLSASRILSPSMGFSRADCGIEPKEAAPNAEGEVSWRGKLGERG